MNKLVDYIEKKFNTDELFEKSKTLHDTYDLFMYDENVWDLIEAVFPEISMEKFNDFRKKVLGHEIVNKLVYNNYPGEINIKYSFIKKLINNKNEISLFEMYVNSSRLDLARINGNSYAYEIKTELDQLTKLEKQLKDYSKAFEYIYVITSENHINKAKNIIPDYCGLILYEQKNNDYYFENIKSPSYNNNYDYEVQVDCFSSKDLETILLNNNINKFKRKEIPTLKDDRKRFLFENFSKDNINSLFKFGVKKKYEKRWGFLQQNFDEIKPIDIQAFFKSNTEPKWIYYKNSLRV